MSKRSVEFFIIDIFVSIDRINRYSSSIKDSNDLILSELVCSAVFRELEIIGEAMKYVLQSEKLTSFIDPSWQRIVNFRNVIAHEYFGIDFEEVFNIISKKIPSLQNDLIILAKKSLGHTDLIVALKSNISDQSQLDRIQSLKYLEKLLIKLEQN